MQVFVAMPGLISFLLLAAHFLHGGSSPLALLSLALCALLLSRDRRIVLIAQAILVLAAVEWIFTTFDIVQERRVEHRDWLRAALILLAVAVFNLGSAALLRLRAVT